jgi:cyclopropane fatty-acyl-phospholipid synthase-like methyltransferase
MKEFERWETRYRSPDYLFGTAPNAFLAAQKAHLPKTGRALAVADGEGRNGVWLAEQGLDVLSIDFSPSAQEKARALARSRGVRLTTELADVTTWEWPADAFDVIAVIFTQFTGPVERERMFAGVRRALRTGGVLLLEGYTPKQLEFGTGGPSNVENMYTRELLEKAFGDFAHVEIAEYETEMSEGARHTGTSAVIDLVARK